MTNSETTETSLKNRLTTAEDFVPDMDIIDQMGEKQLNGLIEEEKPHTAPTEAEKFVTFEQAALDPDLLVTITSKIGWPTPTPIQSMCLPHTLKGRDVAGFAQTGTGKTGVFLITLAQHIKQRHLEPNKPSDKGQPFGVVLTPTRELALQIAEECQKFFSFLGFKSLAVYGGSSWEEQAAKLQQGVDIVIATPGRLKDFYQKQIIALDKTDIFVCDEVDRMFDMGFIDDVEFFLNSIKETTQKLVFSATTNDKVKELAFEYLNHPEYISVSGDEIAPDRIEQHAIICETHNKFKILLGLLSQHQPKRCIIFTNTKLTASWLQYKLKKNEFNADVITGDLPQSKRIDLIRKIKNGQINILIATDVASRGLHISDISHVYNFDLPDDASNYVHRIGRTARAGATGASYSLVCEEYANNFLPIQELLGANAPKSSWYDETFLQIEDKSGNPFEENFGKEFAPLPTREYRPRDNERYASRDSRATKKEFTRPGEQHRVTNRPPASATRSAPATKSSFSLFALFKRFLTLLFSFGRKSKAATSNSSSPSQERPYNRHRSSRPGNSRQNGERPRQQNRPRTGSQGNYPRDQHRDRGQKRPHRDHRDNRGRR